MPDMVDDVPSGDPFRFDEPDWEPLEIALPPEACGDFMFMAHHDGIPGLKLYKHCLIRRYLNLRREADGSIRPYRYTARGEYVLTTWWEAIDQAFKNVARYGVEIPPRGGAGWLSWGSSPRRSSVD